MNRNRSFISLCILLLGGANTAVGGQFDGALNGTYTCGPNLLAGARAVKPFSSPFAVKIAGSVVTGAPTTTETVEAFSGDVSASGIASIKLEGHWANEPARAWVSRFSGTIGVPKGVLLGAMYTQGDSKRVRECALSFVRESAPTVEMRSADIDQGTRRRVDEPLPNSPREIAIAPVPEPATALSNAGMPADAWLGTVPPLFVSKKEFLAAASRGELAGVGSVSDSSADAKAIVASVAYILASDYQTPLPNDRRTGNCASTAESNVFDAFRSRTDRYTSMLSDRPPNFQGRDEPAPTDLNVGSLAGFRQWCSQRVLGKDEPYPVVKSFYALLDEYGDATRRFVESKRGQMVAAYQADLKRKKDVADAAEAERRATLQRQIDSERRRIEEAEQDKKLRASKRISG